MLSDNEILTVSALNRLLKNTIEKPFSSVCVEGEVSSCVRASSGHFYFSLKDSQAQVRCILWRGVAESIDELPQNGDQFLVYGAITLYEAKGDYQIQVKKIVSRGSGKLHVIFERLKKQLQEEGLFDAEKKLQLRRYPSSVGIVTSLKAAALQDILFIIKRYRPDIEVIIYPIPVQGKGSSMEISRVLHIAYERNEVETLLIARGGGSMEDLWAFNEEAVARAIHASPIPIISGIGHETDFTIADFVADARAATPTAGAQLLGNSIHEKQVIIHLYQKIKQYTVNIWNQRQQRLDRIQMRLRHPIAKLYQLRRQLYELCQRMIGKLWEKFTKTAKLYYQLLQRLDKSIPCCGKQKHHCEKLAQKLSLCLHHSFDKAHSKLQTLSKSLTHLNPQNILKRGYSITTDEKGKIISDFKAAPPKSNIRVVLGTGYLEAHVHTSSATKEK